MTGAPSPMERSKLTNDYLDAKPATTSTGRNWCTVTTRFELMEA
jgi:hypothetical protein